MDCLTVKLKVFWESWWNFFYTWALRLNHNARGSKQRMMIMMKLYFCPHTDKLKSKKIFTTMHGRFFKKVEKICYWILHMPLKSSIFFSFSGLNDAMMVTTMFNCTEANIVWMMKWHLCDITLILCGVRKLCSWKWLLVVNDIVQSCCFWMCH